MPGAIAHPLDLSDVWKNSRSASSNNRDLDQNRPAEARIGRWVGEYERRLRARLDPDPSPGAQA